MSAEVFYRAMGLQGYWIVDVWESRGGEMEVLVEPPSESLRYWSCRSRRVHVHERKLRSWKDTPFAGKPVRIMMPSPRVRCLNCGAKTWHQPTFAEGQKRYTKNFEKHVCGWLSRVTIPDVVETYGLSWDTVAEIDQRRLKRLGGPELKTLKRLAIDEVHVGKLHRFDERSRLAEALKLNEPLAQAYYLKDELRLFWQQLSKSAAATFLDDWCRRAEAAGLRVLRTMSHTLRTSHRLAQLVQSPDLHQPAGRHQQQDRTLPTPSLRRPPLRPLQSPTAHAPSHQVHARRMRRCAISPQESRRTKNLIS